MHGGTFVWAHREAQHFNTPDKKTPGDAERPFLSYGGNPSQSPCTCRPGSSAPLLLGPGMCIAHGAYMTTKEGKWARKEGKQVGFAAFVCQPHCLPGT